MLLSIWSFYFDNIDFNGVIGLRFIMLIFQMREIY